MKLLEARLAFDNIKTEIREEKDWIDKAIEWLDDVLKPGSIKETTVHSSGGGVSLILKVILQE